MGETKDEGLTPTEIQALRERMRQCPQGHYIPISQDEAAWLAEHRDEATIGSFFMENAGQLQAERDRYKAALEEIAAGTHTSAYDWVCDCPEAARKALEEEKP